MSSVSEDSKRMIAYNGHQKDENGIIWCIVKENTAGYFPMLGRGEHAAPWYLAHFEHFKDENGEIDYMKANESAEKTAKRWNEEQGHTEKDVQNILSSSIRLGPFD
tara:strand:+ start:611 stop:928 length:318 start_codon:yes stop_codon:yes gene_type:complete